MSMQDPVSDMLTRVRNAQAVLHAQVSMRSSNLKVAIADVLKSEGYINNYVVSTDKIPQLTLELKYDDGEPVISKIKRISRPGLRVYCGVDKIPTVMGGLGITIMSTPKGVLSDRNARLHHVGGEILCQVA